MKLIYFCLFFPVLLFACSEEKAERVRIADAEHEEISEIDTLLLLNNTRVRLVKFSESKRNLILLPGWNYPIEHWEDSTNWLSWARENRVTLIMPDMHKSIYQLENYPQTRPDWKAEKSLSWLNDTLIPHLKEEFDVLHESDEVAVLGISTGGRGAIALAQRIPELIDEAYSLSGDFATLDFPNDNLYRGYFGPLKGNEEIWKAEDLCRKEYSSSISCYLFHAQNDGVVPVAHSQRLEEQIKTKNVRVQLFIQNAGGHNYAYWNEVSHQIQADLLFLSGNH